MFSFRRLALVLLLTLMGSLPLHAQTGPAPVCDIGCGGETDRTAPSALQARSSIRAARGVGSTIVATTPVLSKTVNIEGSKSFTYVVPLLRFPGRGLDINLDLYYNSFIWTTDGSSIQLNADHDSPSYGFRLDYGFMEFSSDWTVGVLTESSGVKHPLKMTSLSSTETRYVSTDSTYIQVVVPSAAGASAVATFKNGFTIQYQGYTGMPRLEYRPWKIEDTNGNLILLTYLNSNNLLLETISDTLQRQERFVYDSTGTMLQCVVDAASCDAPGGTAYRFRWSPYTLNFNFTESAGTLQSGSTQLNVLTDVVQPNGTRVHFAYGDWGIVNQVQELSATGAERFHAKYNFPPASAGAVDGNPSYTQQEIFDGINTATWNYQVSTDPTTGFVTSYSVTDPCGTTTTTTADSTTGLASGLQVTSSSASSMAGCSGVTGRVWRTIGETWATDASGDNPRLTSVTTTLDDNSQSKIVFNSYDANGNPTDVVKYDFGAGAPGPKLAEVITSYAALGNHILDRPSDVQIKDGNGNLVVHKKFNYDETAVAGLNPAPVFHDETNYSATGTLARGNLTSAVVYANAAAGTGAVTTTFTYDEAGNRRSAQTGCCTFENWNFSTTNQYAYPDSVSIGPSNNQLTTSFVYDWFGRVITKTDPNGLKTTFDYDVMNRPVITTTPDNVTARIAYDDNSASPSVTMSNSANSLVTKSILDGRGRTLTEQVLNGTTVVSTKSSTYNVVGETLQSSNPYGPAETPLYTTFSYDAMGRVTTTTPPALSSVGAQNAYQMTYSGATVTLIDPAIKQRKQFRDAFGRIVRIDEPGLAGASAATGSATISGTEQSIPSTSASNGATAGTATVVIGAVNSTPDVNGSYDRSTQVQTQFAAPALITLTIQGTDGTDSEVICTRPTQCRTITFKDSGNLGFTVTVGATTFTVSAGYDAAQSGPTLATALYNAFPANSAVTMSNPGGTASFTLTTVAKGSGSNSASVTAFVNSSYAGSENIGVGPGFSFSPSSGNFSGGRDDAFATVYDTGNVTMSVTANGTTYSKTSTYGQSSTVSSIANDLYNKFIADSGFNQVVRINPPGTGSTLQMTTVATGANTNDPLNTSAATTSSLFAAGSTSFTASPPGASTFTPGQNGILYDSGTVTLTVTGFTTALQPSKSVTYGQGSTGAGIAAQLATQIHNDPFFPVDATVNAGSATINFTARNTGVDGNQYVINIKGQSSLSSSFSAPSFPNSPASTATLTAALSGGVDGTPSLAAPAVLSTFYSYDPAGNLLQVRQGQQTRTYVYDGLGRLTSATMPETGNQAVKYSYTDFDAIAQRIDPRTLAGTSTAVTATYAYDSLDRLATVSYNDGTPGVTFTYNPPGSANNTGARLASVQVGSSTNPVELETYQYDLLGRPTQCAKNIGGVSYVTGYQYNTDGSLASTTYPSGRTVAYNYDAIGRLTQIGSNAVALLNGIAYNAAGNVTGATYGNGVQATFGYNNQLQLSSLVYGSTAAGTLMSLNYNYGGAQNNGQIQGVTDNLVSARTTQYTYDELGRLKMARTTDLTSPSTWKLNYTYDRYGNRLAQVPTSGTAAAPINQLLIDPATNRMSGGGFVYDAAGNVIADGAGSYTFDAENRMASVTPVGGAAESFAYGVDGLRMKKNGTIYIYSGGRPIAEYSGGAAAASPNVEYVYSGGRLLATLAGGSTTYAYADHLSARLFANGSATQTGSSTLLPYGESVSQTGNPGKWLFTTYERDNAAGDTGLDDANARFYSSRVGRMASVDPLSGNITNPQTLNRYSYVANDPIDFVDPSGKAMRGIEMLCALGDDGNFVFCVGTGQAIIDGQYMAGSISSILKGDLVTPCPDNICSRDHWAPDPEGGHWQTEKFWAFANGGSGYYSLVGPGALYFGMDAAGKAATGYYEDETFNDPQHRERGGNIYQDANEVFSYNYVAIGGPCQEGDTCSISIPNEVPDGATLVADWHDHPFARESYSMGGDQQIESATHSIMYVGAPITVPGDPSELHTSGFGNFRIDASGQLCQFNTGGPQMVGVGWCK